jgi:hypothetical protein
MKRIVLPDIKKRRCKNCKRLMKKVGPYLFTCKCFPKNVQVAYV